MKTTGSDMTGSGGGGDQGDNHVAPPSAAECRLRRRRRHVLEEEGEEEDGSSDGGEEGSAAASLVAASVVPLPEGAAMAAKVWPMAFGCVSVAGRLRDMEDTVSLHPSLCVWADGSAVHFFAVYDGHGGSQVSAVCRDQMHSVLAAELAAEAARYQQRGAAGGREEEEELAWKAALSRAFARVDAIAAALCACGGTAPCGCPLADDDTAGCIVGSTAVVALLVRDRLIVANCGDSRAVLSRSAGSRAVPLSSDQKPDRPDEKARIEAAGGRVVYLSGARVRGILAMSRALGHKYLKPEVICEPEITITKRTGEDDCLILASDGMWDVISNQTACAVTQQCLEDGSPTGAAWSGEAAPGGNTIDGPFEEAATGQQSDPRCYRAATLLSRLALGRETSDNISVIVIDLKGRG